MNDESDHTVNGATHPLRAPCICGHSIGYITERNGQDVVRCVRCDRYAYNVPREESGRKVRSLSTRPGITPSQRWRIFETHDHSCVGCGTRANLQLAHLISREDAAKAGCLDDLIDSEWNLAPMCAECNSGQRGNSVTIRMMYRLMLIKATPK